MHTAAATEYDDRFHLSRKRYLQLLALSSLWFTVNDTPLLPVGFFFALRFVGANYETTFFHSLRTGHKVVFACLGVALFSLLVFGPHTGFSIGAGGVSFQLTLR
ncbi:hypothetical protein SAMN05443572_10968 [Myxococcus fulvus]|uniref:Uncharacterized protein n=2 Tax=Myxococcus fulvus TaxID=33 RepID=A0A511T651_MYXFU|nr:hypothetical protein MFU01_44540 [Myxococcus fulvus]SEU32072.1 hypothetical protein SAMN05443572_10968 [Myxococcus fulvus]